VKPSKCFSNPSAKKQKTILLAASAKKIKGVTCVR
jgi:hypothetical protein